jgi:hypothetical protein
MLSSVVGVFTCKRNWCYCHLLTGFLLGFAELDIFNVFCRKKQSTVRYGSLRLHMEEENEEQNDRNRRGDVERKRN